MLSGGGWGWGRGQESWQDLREEAASGSSGTEEWKAAACSLVFLTCETGSPNLFLYADGKLDQVIVYCDLPGTKIF